MRARLWQAITGCDAYESMLLSTGRVEYNTPIAWVWLSRVRRRSRTNHFDKIRDRTKHESLKGQIGIALDEYWPTIEPRLP